METTQNNQVTVIEKSLDVLKAGPAILQANQLRGSKAVTVGNNILALIIQNGMTPELDERARKYLVNCAAAVKEMKEERASVTQIMHELKKMFTSVENSLDIAKEGTPAAKIQAERNRYAKKLADEQKRKQQEADRELARSQAIIAVRTEAGKGVAAFVTNLVAGKKSKMSKAFNEATLESIADVEARLNSYVPQLVEKEWNTFSYCGIYPAVLSGEEVRTVVSEVITGQFQLQAELYVKIMLEHREDLLDKLPSKMSELEEQKRLADEAAEAKSEEEKKASLLRIQQMEDEQKRREEEEESRIKKEAAEAKKKAEEDIDIKKQGDQAMLLFEREAAVAEVTPVPEARQGYEIVVLHPAGYAQIFQFWFEKEGNKLAIDKIGNTKLDSMKSFCEKYAHKHNEKIESKLLRYDETHKAVNRKEAVK